MNKQNASKSKCSLSVEADTPPREAGLPPSLVFLVLTLELLCSTFSQLMQSSRPAKVVKRVGPRRPREPGG